MARRKQQSPVVVRVKAHRLPKPPPPPPPPPQPENPDPIQTELDYVCGKERDEVVSYLKDAVAALNRLNAKPNKKAWSGIPGIPEATGNGGSIREWLATTDDVAAVQKFHAGVRLKVKTMRIL